MFENEQTIYKFVIKEKLIKKITKEQKNKSNN